jgi:hypothetical protein
MKTIILFALLLLSLSAYAQNTRDNIKLHLPKHKREHKMLLPALLTAAGSTMILTVPSKPFPTNVYQYTLGTVVLGNGIVWGIQKLCKPKKKKYFI